MSIARNFDDFKEEIELAFIQNACVEIELYSIIASVIRESNNKQKLSIRDVSSRRKSKISEKFYGSSGFPDLVSNGKLLAEKTARYFRRFLRSTAFYFR